MKSLPRRVGLFCVALILIALVAAPATGFSAEKKSEAPSKPSPAQTSAEPANDLPASEVTLGARAGDGVNEGFGDILAPVFALKSGIFFINPRMSASDHSAEEYNLGAGYRHLIPNRNFILGANIYYDHRETERDSSFNQLGLGVEFMSEWVDARANYYKPENEKEVVNEYSVETVTQSSSSGPISTWYEPYASGNQVLQDGLQTRTYYKTTTIQYYEQYEEAMEGVDCEVGVKLPIPGVKDYADVKVFGGYYYFNANFGAEDLKGFKGRLEVKALPSLYLDAEVYEDKELNGSDYFLGARMRVPFDVANISKGRNPFAGTMTGFKPSAKAAPFSSRLTEMVMRDLQVRTDISEETEIVEKRQVSTAGSGTSQARVAVPVQNNVTFVDGDNATGVENGSAANPYRTITNGVAHVIGQVVYVWDQATNYEENVMMKEGLVIWGSGCPMPANGGFTFGNGIYPTVDGMSKGPTITMANSTTLRGMRIINTEDFVSPSQQITLPGYGNIESRRIGILGNDVNNIVLDCVRARESEFGAVFGKNGSFQATITDSRFNRNDMHGLTLEGVGASGSFVVDVSGSRFRNNGEVGLLVDAESYDTASVTLADNLAEKNDDDGMDIELSARDSVALTVTGSSFNNNKGDGFDADLLAGGDLTVTMQHIDANDNKNDGVYVEAYSTNSGLAKGVFEDIEASGNRDTGLEVCDLGNQGLGDTEARFSDIWANDNDSDGVDLDIFSQNGNLDVVIGNVQANWNGEDGLYLGYLYGYGGANVAISGVDAFDNDGSGIRSYNLGSGTGTTFVTLTDVDAIDNGVDGVWFDIGLYGSCPIDVTASDITANYNGEDGLVVGLEGSGTLAVDVSGVEAIGNGWDTKGAGVFVYADSDGTIDANVRDIVAQSNSSHGVEVVLAGPGEIVASISGVVAEDNGGRGVLARMGTTGGIVDLTVSNVTANLNDNTGIDMELNAEGSLTVALIDLTANNSTGGRGVRLQASSSDGPLAAILENVTANGNNERGVVVDLSSEYGNITADLSGITARTNTDGIRVVANTTYGGVSVMVEDSTLNRNSDTGLRVDLTARSNVSFMAQNNVIVSNTTYGVRIVNAASTVGTVTLDLGNGGAGSAGQNSIFGSGTRDVRNQSATTAMAQSNWWGQVPPVAGQFQGPVNRNNWLTSNPHP